MLSIIIPTLNAATVLGTTLAAFATTSAIAYEIIVAERADAVTYTAEELYFGPLLMQARSPAFLFKWQRMLRQKQQTLANFARARQPVPEDKLREMTRQARWISDLLA